MGYNSSYWSTNYDIICPETAIDEIKIDGSTIFKVVENGNYTATATMSPSGTNDNVTWSISDATIATINSSTGALNALIAGEVTLTATACIDSSIKKDVTSQL